MKITRDLAFEQVLLDKIAQQEFKERTGVHCTDLVYCLNKQALRRLQPKPAERSEILRFGRGWATQRWLTGKLFDVEEVTMDGITVTLDDLYEDCPWELKDTDQASKKPIEDNIAWVRQLMAQCYVRKVLVGRLSRLENMGDWGWVYPRGSTPEEKKESKAKSKHPDLSVWKFEFTVKEIEKNWEWLCNRRDLFSKILETGELLSKAIALPPRQGYECDYCPYREEVEC